MKIISTPQSFFTLLLILTQNEMNNYAKGDSDEADLFALVEKPVITQIYAPRHKSW